MEEHVPESRDDSANEELDYDDDREKELENDHWERGTSIVSCGSRRWIRFHKNIGRKHFG